MNPSTTALTLNLQLPNIATVSWAVQGDLLSRVITATLVDGSTAWNPQAGYHGVVRYHKPDGTSGVYDVDEDGNVAVTWTGNIATITVAHQALTVAGTVLMQLEFYDSNDARVSTFGWANNVQPSAVTDNEFLSSDYYNILSLQIAGVLGASSHPPYINSNTKNWMVWDENAASYVDSGYSSEGTPGPAPSVTSTAYEYANSNSGTTVPTSWSGTRPATSPGTWAWTKTTITFDNDSTTTVYTTAYQGQDGAGSPGTSVPLGGSTTGVVGTAVAYSREDHQHPFPSASDIPTTDSDSVQTHIDNIEQYLSAIHPVGSIYLSTDSTSPALLFGGTWEQIENVFLLAAGSSYSAGQTGGEATHLLTAAESGQKSVTTASNGSHSHTATTKYSNKYAQGTNRLGAWPGGSDDSYTTTDVIASNGAHTHTISGSNASSAHNNMPPYLAVYMWKRTA